jgi:WD40 repeat protein
LLICQPNFGAEKIASGKRIAVLTRPDYQGEYSFAHRIKAACSNLNWKADILEIRHFNRLKRNKYDFVINLVPGTPKLRRSTSYLAIFHPVHHYFTPHGSIKTLYSDYDGYLLSYSPKRDEKIFWDQKLPYISWYPTVQEREYRKVNPTHLFYLACLWGDRFKGPKMQQLLRLLDQEPYMRVYGNKLITQFCPQRYCSTLPFDADSVCEAASQAGVTLVLHSQDHNVYGLPSGRIFEAAAASTVIICDDNAFVKTHFGDSVLYINTNENIESICRQIQSHMNWIQLNKAEALDKARRAHAIYKNHFLLETQILRLGEFHDQLSKKIFLKWATKIGSALSSWLRKISAFSLRGLGMATNPIINPIPFAVLRNIDCQYSLINSVDFHPRENMFCVTYTHNNKISLYQIDEHHQPHIVQTLSNPVAQLSEPQHAAFSPDGKKIVVANWTNQTLNVYLREGNLLFSERPANTIAPPKDLQRCKPHGIAFSRCGNYLAVAYGAASYFERGIALFQSQGLHLECVDFLKDRDFLGIPKGITFSPDGTHLLVTFCEPSCLSIYHIKNQKIDPIPTQTISARLSRPEDIKISPNGRHCAVTNSDQNTITFYSFDSKSNSICENIPFYTLQNPEACLSFPHGIAFSPDGQYLAITQFGQVQTTEQGDISWSHTMKSSEAAVHLYSITE